LRGAAAQLGINAITVEIGNPHTFQLRYLFPATRSAHTALSGSVTHLEAHLLYFTFACRYIKSALIGVDNILGFLNMISHDEPEREYEPAICSSSYWLFTDVGGLLGSSQSQYHGCAALLA
jgi:hypothetical protein